MWMQVYANFTLRGVKGYIPPLVPPFLHPLWYFDFHTHHLSYKRVTVPSFPQSGKQGDWDWKDHCSMCSHGPQPHIQYVFSKQGSWMLPQHCEEVFTAVTVCSLRHRISFNSSGFSLQHLFKRKRWKPDMAVFNYSYCTRYKQNIYH